MLMRLARLAIGVPSPPMLTPSSSSLAVPVKQDLPVKDQQHDQHRKQHHRPDNHAQHNQQTHGEQRQIQRKRAAVEPRLLAEEERQRRGGERQTACGEKHERQRPEGQRRADKVGKGEVVKGIEIQILRIAHGREHAAEIGGDGLQHDDTDEIVPAVGQPQHDDSKGHEGQKRHVVGDEHGGEEA